MRRVRGGPDSFPSGLLKDVLQRHVRTEEALGLDFVGTIETKSGTEIHFHKDGQDAIVFLRDGKPVVEVVCVDYDAWDYDVYQDDGSPTPKPAVVK